MGIGRKIMAGIVLAVAAMVVKRYMKKRGEEERRDRIRQTAIAIYDIDCLECKINSYSRMITAYLWPNYLWMPVRE